MRQSECASCDPMYPVTGPDNSRLHSSRLPTAVIDLSQGFAKCPELNVGLADRVWSRARIRKATDTVMRAKAETIEATMISSALRASLLGLFILLPVAAM